MGRAKQAWMEVGDRGYELLDDRLVCIRCIKDAYLKKIHAKKTARGKCDFCDRIETIVSNAALIQIQIMESLLSDYENIEDAGAPYETAEGGWQISHESARDIVSDNISSAVAEEFGIAIVEAVDSSISWSERDWLILSTIARMRYGWTQFCNVVQSQLRFSFAFFEGDEDTNHPDYTHPALTLREIGRLVDKLNLIRVMEPGSLFYRVRVDDGVHFSTFKDLGSPPPEKAAANRMSPAGIPMLYGAHDIETAIQETWDGAHRVLASIATFRTTQPIRIIDFTNLPKPPSYWSNPGRKTLADYGFLYELAADLSKPVTLGSKIDLDYAPTQIVSEYLTKAWRGLPCSWNSPPDLVHGLAFRSSKTGMKNYGLNFLREENPMYGLNQTNFLELVQVEHRELHPL